MPETSGTRRCAWCEATAPEDATSCPACGAALAQREDIAGLVIPGLTSVDPALLAFDARPLHLAGNSPTQSAASGVIPAVALGGPMGAVVLGGLAAVAAAEYLGARGEGASTPETLEAVGRPSEAALQAVARLDRGEVLAGEAPRSVAAGPDAGPTIGPDAGSGAGQDAGPEAGPGAGPGAATGHD